MVPSSCHGVVFAAGNGKCQEMLSLRIVVVPRARAVDTPARSTRRSMSERIVSGVTRRTATVLLLPTASHLCIERHRIVARVLLDDGEQPGVQEAHHEKKEE